MGLLCVSVQPQRTTWALTAWGGKNKNKNQCTSRPQKHVGFRVWLFNLWPLKSGVLTPSSGFQASHPSAITRKCSQNLRRTRLRSPNGARWELVLKTNKEKKAAEEERNWREKDEGRSVLNRASSTGPFDWHVWNINPGALQPWRTPYINLVNIQDKMHSSSSYLHSSLFFPLISAVEHFHDASATEPSCIMYKR